MPKPPKATITKVRKREGPLEPFDPNRIEKAISKAFKAMKEKERGLPKKLTQQVVSKLEKLFAGSIPGVEDIQDIVEQTLIENKLTKVATAYIVYRRKRAEAREIRRILGVSDDLKFDLNSILVLKSRYLLRDEEGRVIETPAQLFRRVARTVAAADAKYGKSRKDVEKLEEEFYNAMVSREFMPNSPTLMNAGTPLNQLFACFVFPIEDSLESIFDTLKHAALTHQSGGGTGFNFSHIRPKGDLVKSTHGVASGPVSFMRIYDMMTEVIKQGGCISASSFIRTDAGLRPAQELLNCRTHGENFTKDLVFTNDCFEHALLAEDNGIAKVFRIRTELGTEIKLTYNHQIQVIGERGEFTWKTADKVRQGDWVVHRLGGYSGYDQELPRVGKQYRTAKKLSVPDRMNPALAELLGIYVADGCISSGGRIVFAIEDKDIELQQRIKSLMKTLFGLIGCEEKKRNDASICIVFHSHDLCRWFERLGWKKEGAGKAFVPRHIMTGSRESALAFIRGLFEGDGDVHSDGYPRLYTVSERLAHEIQQLLLALGIVCRIKAHNSNNRFGRCPVWHCCIIQERSRQIFARQIGFVSERKNAKLRTAMAMRKKLYEPSDVIPNQGAYLRGLYKGPGRDSGPGRSKRGADVAFHRAVGHHIWKDNRQLTRKRLRELMTRFPKLAQDERLRQLADESYFYSRVASITSEYDYTMDLTVPIAEQFVANGILVHNKRRGANMGILQADHPDILEFIGAKANRGALRNFNISVAVTDDFMRKAEKRQEYELINPHTGKVEKKLNAGAVFDLIVNTAWRTGDPGLIFLDEINKHNPTPKLGRIESTNPCGELPLLPYEPCVLGSINLGKVVDERKKAIDWNRLRRLVRMGVHFLDNTIDVNKFPLPEVEKISKGNRKIGLGVMGFADMLIRLGIPYDSVKALKMAEKLMKFISDESHKMSMELAKERGSFPNFKGSVWEKKGFKAMRNATTTTVAPTGTIGMIAGCSSGIEPIFAVSFVRSVLEGTKLLETNSLFERTAIERGFYSRELMAAIARKGTVQGLGRVPKDVQRLFVTALDIKPEWHVRMQAAFQKYVDNSVSKTVNLPNDATPEEVRSIYLLAWKLRCKGITVFRYGSKEEQVLYVGEVAGKKPGEREYVEVKSEYGGGPQTGVCAGGECVL